MIANCITACRILSSVCLLFLQPRSGVFLACYLLGGLTDAVDGTVARVEGTQSRFGACFDTVADAVFLASAAVRILPFVALPAWVWAWAIAAAALKLAVTGFSSVSAKSLTLPHTVLNKAAGLVLFLSGIAFCYAKHPEYSAVLACAVTSLAATDDLQRSVKKGFFSLKSTVSTRTVPAETAKTEEREPSQ